MKDKNFYIKTHDFEFCINGYYELDTDFVFIRLNELIVKSDYNLIKIIKEDNHRIKLIFENGKNKKEIKLYSYSFKMYDANNFYIHKEIDKIEYSETYELIKIENNIHYSDYSSDLQKEFGFLDKSIDELSLLIFMRRDNYTTIHILIESKKAKKYKDKINEYFNFLYTKEVIK